MELSYGAIRQRQLLDSWIDHLGKVSAKKQPPSLRWLLHLGLYQILFMEKIPNSAAVNTTVELAKKNKLTKLAPVVNGVLRSAIRTNKDGFDLPLPINSAEKIAHQESIPLWLIEKLILWQGVKNAEKIAKAFNQVPTLDIRVNNMRRNKLQLQNIFKEVGIESKFILDCPSGLQISNGSGDIKKLPGFFEGEWFVQDRSSQLACPLLNPQPGDRVLDACAAPGIKTTHLAQLMNDIGELWAVDSSLKRLKRMFENAKRLKSKCLKILHADATLLLKTHPHWEGYFDRILIDAPCSGLGTLSRHPDAKWRVNSKMVEELVLLQKNLLEGLLPLLKSGGKLVYSTCTIHPDENVNQIKNLITSHPELKVLDQKQIWPLGEGYGDGFYIAKINS